LTRQRPRRQNPHFLNPQIQNNHPRPRRLNRLLNFLKLMMPIRYHRFHRQNSHYRLIRQHLRRRRHLIHHLQKGQNHHYFLVTEKLKVNSLCRLFPDNQHHRQNRRYHRWSLTILLRQIHRR
jgi:hypothetical protein